MSAQRQFEKATLHSPKGATWLIIFYCIHPDTGRLQRVRKTFDLNRITDLKERRAAAAAMIVTINAALESGWNYFTANIPEAAPLLTLEAAFLRGYEAKIIGNGKASLNSFNSIKGIFLQWLRTNKLHTMPPGSFTEAHLQRYVSHRSASGKGLRNLNAHINLIKAVFGKMHKPLRLIPEHPLQGFPLFKPADSDLFEPLTVEELRAVANELRAKVPYFRLYTMFIYYAHMRPTHIGKLRRAQLDFDGDLINIKGKTTKSKRNAAKQLLSVLRAELVALGVDAVPGDYFVFSRDFLPGPEPYSTIRNRAEEIWRELVIHGLGINKKMYALKHTSGQLYLSDNDDIDAGWLQQQMEHSSLAETDAYIKSRKVKRVDEGKVNVRGY